MREHNISKTKLARQMGITLVQVDRILDVTHNSRIEHLEAAIQALGLRYHVEMEDAAE
jgi:antitoxin HicB